jgi:hypothetical protein
MDSDLNQDILSRIEKEEYAMHTKRAVFDRSFLAHTVRKAVSLTVTNE